MVTFSCDSLGPDKKNLVTRTCRAKDYQGMGTGEGEIVTKKVDFLDFCAFLMPNQLLLFCVREVYQLYSIMFYKNISIYSYPLSQPQNVIPPVMQNKCDRNRPDCPKSDGVWTGGG